MVCRSGENSLFTLLFATFWESAPRAGGGNERGRERGNFGRVGTVRYLDALILLAYRTSEANETIVNSILAKKEP